MPKFTLEKKNCALYLGSTVMVRKNRRKRKKGGKYNNFRKKK